MVLPAVVHGPTGVLVLTDHGCQRTPFCTARVALDRERAVAIRKRCYAGAESAADTPGATRVGGRHLGSNGRYRRDARDRRGSDDSGRTRWNGRERIVRRLDAGL